MKSIFSLFLPLFLFISPVTGQPYQDGRKYKAVDITYLCTQHINPINGNIYFIIKNIHNVLDDQPSNEPDASMYKPPQINSEKLFFEIICEAYGGKENMLGKAGESLDCRFIIGMDFTVKEISFSLAGSGYSTTPLELEKMEKAMKEKLIFTFDRDKPWFKRTVYLTQNRGYDISGIPALLEKMQ